MYSMCLEAGIEQFNFVGRPMSTNNWALALGAFSHFTTTNDGGMPVSG